MSSTRPAKSARQRGVKIILPVVSLAGSGSKRRKVKATPTAAQAASKVTPERRALNAAFTVDNEYVTRVLGKRSEEEIKDIGQGLVEAFNLAAAAGVTDLPTPAGGFLKLVTEGSDVAGTIKLLVDLAVLGKWKCSTSAPDLPSGYPDDPSMSQAKGVFVCGLHQLEFKARKAAKGKAPMTIGIFKGLRIGSKHSGQLCVEVMKELGKEALTWRSDTGSVTPWRVEFYLRSMGVDEPTVVRVMPSYKSGKSVPQTSATTKLMAEVVTALIKDVREMAATAKRIEEQLRIDKIASEAAAAEAKESQDLKGGSNDGSFMSAA